MASPDASTVTEEDTDTGKADAAVGWSITKAADESPQVLSLEMVSEPQSSQALLAQASTEAEVTEAEVIDPIAAPVFPSATAAQSPQFSRLLRRVYGVPDSAESTADTGAAENTTQNLEAPLSAEDGEIAPAEAVETVAVEDAEVEIVEVEVVEAEGAERVERNTLAQADAANDEADLPVLQDAPPPSAPPAEVPAAPPTEPSNPRNVP